MAGETHWVGVVLVCVLRLLVADDLLGKSAAFNEQLHFARPLHE